MHENVPDASQQCTLFQEVKGQMWAAKAGCTSPEAVMCVTESLSIMVGEK